MDSMKRARSDRESEPRATKMADTERSAENLEQCFGGLELHATASVAEAIMTENLKRNRSPDNSAPKPEKRAENGRRSQDEPCRVVVPVSRGTKLQDPKTRCFAKLNRRFKQWPKEVLYIVNNYLQNECFDQTSMGGKNLGGLGQHFRFLGSTLCICPLGPKLVVSQASVSPAGCAEWVFHISENQRWSCGVVPQSQLAVPDILQTHGIGIRTAAFATAALPQRDVRDKVIRMWLDRGTVRIFADGKEEFLAQVPPELFPVRFGIVCFFGARVRLLEESP